MQQINQKRPKKKVLLVFLPLIAVLAGCGPASTTPTISPVVQSKTPGKVLATEFPKIQQASAVGVNWGNSPNLNLQGTKLITRFGATYVTELVGARSQLFVRTTPKSNWNNLGYLPGNVLQLDFPSSNDGFAISQTQTQEPGSTLLDLYSTSNAGKSWGLVTRASFVQVHFFNSQDGIALLESSSSNSNGTSAFSVSTTSNSGKSWNSVSSTLIGSFGYLSPRYVGFSFGTPKTGYLAIEALATSPHDLPALEVEYKSSADPGVWFWVMANPSLELGKSNCTTLPGRYPRLFQFDFGVVRTKS